MGLNHYGSYYVHRTFEQGKDWGSDSQIWTTPYNKTNHLIGPFAESDWLNVVPEGFRRLISWIDKRYNHTKIYVFENGVSVPHENDLPLKDALHDSFRVHYYKQYINALE